MTWTRRLYRLAWVHHLLCQVPARTVSAAAELGLVISIPKTEYTAINMINWSLRPPLEVYGSTINRTLAQWCYSGDLKRRDWRACMNSIWEICEGAQIFQFPPRSSCLIPNVSLSFQWMAVNLGPYLWEWKCEKVRSMPLAPLVMFNIKRNDWVTNITIIWESNSEHPTNIRSRQLKSFKAMYFGCLMMSHARSMRSMIPHHMGRERKRTLLLRYTQHLFGDTENMVGTDKLYEIAQARCCLRKLVVASSAADSW